MCVRAFTVARDVRSITSIGCHVVPLNRQEKTPPSRAVNRLFFCFCRFFLFRQRRWRPHSVAEQTSRCRSVFGPAGYFGLFGSRVCWNARFRRRHFVLLIARHQPSRPQFYGKNGCIIVCCVQWNPMDLRNSEPWSSATAGMLSRPLIPPLDSRRLFCCLRHGTVGLQMRFEAVVSRFRIR